MPILRQSTLRFGTEAPCVCRQCTHANFAHHPLPDPACAYHSQPSNAFLCTVPVQVQDLNILQVCGQKALGVSGFTLSPAELAFAKQPRHGILNNMPRCTHVSQPAYQHCMDCVNCDVTPIMVCKGEGCLVEPCKPLQALDSGYYYVIPILVLRIQVQIMGLRLCSWVVVSADLEATGTNCLFFTIVVEAMTVTRA